MDHVHAISRGDAGYPGRLAVLADGPDPIWIAGRYSGQARAVAVVGARAASRGALDRAQALGAGLARAGIDVVSGGAFGVDAAAHEGALSAGGVTIAVLGTGIDVSYPSQHAPLYQRIVESGGALVSQFAPGTLPRAGQFPTRNKVIAALAEAVVVVEAGSRSGSLHTAKAARLLGRRLAAAPGSVGCDRLLLDGALPVDGTDDVLAVLEGRPLAEPERPTIPRRRGSTRRSIGCRAMSAIWRTAPESRSAPAPRARSIWRWVDGPRAPQAGATSGCDRSRGYRMPAKVVRRRAPPKRSPTRTSRPRRARQRPRRKAASGRWWWSSRPPRRRRSRSTWAPASP